METIYNKISIADPSPDGKMIRNDMRRLQLVRWIDKSKIASNGRLLLRKPRIYRSCSAEEEDGSRLDKYGDKKTVPQHKKPHIDNLA
jgi:hypothetical protein